MFQPPIPHGRDGAESALGAVVPRRHPVPDTRTTMLLAASRNNGRSTSSYLMPARALISLIFCMASFIVSSTFNLPSMNNCQTSSSWE